MKVDRGAKAGSQMRQDGYRTHKLSHCSLLSPSLLTHTFQSPWLTSLSLELAQKARSPGSVILAFEQ
jgi:hypothetical protein